MTYWKPPKYANLRGVMAQRGMRINDLADEMGKSHATISNKLSNRNRFTMDEAYKILALLEIPASQIYEFFPPNGEVQS